MHNPSGLPERKEKQNETGVKSEKLVWRPMSSRFAQYRHAVSMLNVCHTCYIILLEYI